MVDDNDDLSLSLDDFGDDDLGEALGGDDAGDNGLSLDAELDNTGDMGALGGDDMFGSMTGSPATGAVGAVGAVGGISPELQAAYDIPVQVSAVLGKATMQVSQLLKLGRGAVVELDRKVGEPIDIYVNSRLVARGEVVVVDDRLGVTMTEIIKSDAQR